RCRPRRARRGQVPVRTQALEHAAHRRRRLRGSMRMGTFSAPRRIGRIAAASAVVLAAVLTGSAKVAADGAKAPATVALWLFDEPAGLYPSSTLDDSSG